MSQERYPTKAEYPLGEHQRDKVTSRTGRALSELTLEQVRASSVGPEDLSIHPETLRAQAAIAEEAGFPQLAANLRRAAELTAVPDKVVFSIYEALRPYRVTYERMLALADELERDYGATENGRFVREAAQAYRARGLF
jgi:propanediol dehydratase small subunit